MLGGMALATRVRVALKEHPATRDIDITIEAHEGRVSMSGIVMSGRESDEARMVAAAVPGVTEVDNRLRMMTPTRRFASSKET